MAIVLLYFISILSLTPKDKRQNSNSKIKKSIFRFGSNQLIALAMNIYDFNRIIFFQMLAQLRYVHVHTAGIEIIVINPNRLQSKVALKDLISMCTEQA